MKSLNLPETEWLWTHKDRKYKITFAIKNGKVEVEDIEYNE